jgi:formate hydrogenlyase subunit 3/multisubunit Na+/H+ antiporter MnhD subunit
MKKLILGVVLLTLSGVLMAQGSMYTKVDQGVSNTVSTAISILAWVVLGIGIIATFVGLLKILKPTDRQSPGEKKNGFWLLALGIVFSSGVGMYLADGFSSEFFGSGADTAKSKWESEFGGGR